MGSAELVKVLGCCEGPGQASRAACAKQVWAQSVRGAWEGLSMDSRQRNAVLGVPARNTTTVPAALQITKQA